MGTVLYFTALYCTLLYCTALYCTVLYCTVLYSTVLYYTVLHCTVLYCTVLYCTVLYYTVLLCTILYCTLQAQKELLCFLFSLLSLLTFQLGNLDCDRLANLLWFKMTQFMILRLLLNSGFALTDLFLYLDTSHVSVSVSISFPLMMKRVFAHINLFTFSFLVSSDHLVCLGLGFTLPLRLQMTDFLLHLLQCVFAG